MKRRSIASKFWLGDKVRFALDDEAVGIITSLRIGMEGTVVYLVTWANRCDSEHFTAELVPDPAAIPDPPSA